MTLEVINLDLVNPMYREYLQRRLEFPTHHPLCQYLLQDMHHLELKGVMKVVKDTSLQQRNLTTAEVDLEGGDVE